MGSCLSLGLDVSKGRIDGLFLHEAGTPLPGAGSFDDTDSGHRRLVQEIRGKLLQFPEVTLLVGFEATGGLELNWHATLDGLTKEFPSRLKVFRLRGLDVRRYKESEPIRRTGDMASARAIAHMVLERHGRLLVAPPPATGELRLVRLIRSISCDRARNICRLKADLPAIQPEMVGFCQNGLPNWVREVLTKYPTAYELANANIDDLEDIPHVSHERAQTLIARAEKTVAAMTDAESGFVIKMRLKTIQSFDEQYADASKELIRALRSGNRGNQMDLLTSIPGIGEHTAAVFLAETGGIEKFSSVKKLISFAGLNPVNLNESGDLIDSKHISKHGNAHIRSILHMAALSAVQHNKPCKEFYKKLCDRGKKGSVALVAVMVKLLRQMYAVLKTKKTYDPEREATRRQQALKQQQNRSEQKPITAKQTTLPDIHAPVSRIEARKRKNAVAQHTAQRTGSKPQKPLRANRPKIVQTTETCQACH